MKKSPLMVQMAFAHAHTDLPAQFFSPEIWGSPAAEGCRNALFNEGLIDKDDRGTDKLRFWVEYVCKIPWPEQNFIIPLEPGPIVRVPTIETVTKAELDELKSIYEGDAVYLSEGILVRVGDPQ